MSLVDYASSDEEDNVQPSATAVGAEERDDDSRKIQSTSYSLSPSPSPPPPYQSSALHSRSTKSSSNQQSKDVPPLLPPPIVKLPDASILLNSPISSQSIGTDHSSRVAAAMAKNASRKRDANGSSSSNIRGKIPRGNLPHSKNIPDTGSSQLVPPQLSGRSNVVTEDINKLFVRKSSQGKS